MSELRTAVRVGAVRFLTGVGSFFLVWFPLSRPVNGVTLAPARLVAVANLSLCLVAGYLVALGLLRPTLHSARGIEGRRSFFAGLSAICLVAMIDWAFEVFNAGSGMLYGLHASRIAMEGIAFLIGGLMTVVLFLGWLTENERDAEEMTDAVGSIAARLFLARPKPERAAPLIVRVHSDRRRRGVGVELDAGEIADIDHLG